MTTGSYELTNGYWMDGTVNDDLLTGSDGNDTLLGYEGNDYLIGYGGSDYLAGGLGADTFAFNSPFDGGVDVIADFNPLEGDIIQVSQLGFGATSPYDFSYDTLSGDLSFQGSVFANIENVPTDFVPEYDISIV